MLSGICLNSESCGEQPSRKNCVPRTKMGEPEDFEGLSQCPLPTVGGRELAVMEGAWLSWRKLGFSCNVQPQSSLWQSEEGTTKDTYA